MKIPLILVLIFQFILPIPILADWSSDFGQGKKAYDSFEIEKAVALLEKAVQASNDEKNIDKKELSEAYFLLAVSYVTLEEIEKAVNAFESVLKINERFSVDTSLYSPKVVEVFERVKKKVSEENQASKAATPINEGNLNVESSKIILPTNNATSDNGDFEMMKSFFAKEEEPQSNAWLWVGLGLAVVATGVTYALIESQNKSSQTVDSLPRATALRVRIP